VLFNTGPDKTVFISLYNLQLSNFFLYVMATVRLKDCENR